MNEIIKNVLMDFNKINWGRIWPNINMTKPKRRWRKKFFKIIFFPVNSSKMCKYESGKRLISTHKLRTESFIFKCWTFSSLFSKCRWFIEKNAMKIKRKFYSPNTIALWKMDRGRRAVRRLVDIEFVMMAQCYVAFRIFDNCKNWLCNRASCAPFRAAVETIEPKSDTNKSNKLFIHSVFCVFFSFSVQINANVHEECKFFNVNYMKILLKVIN